MLKFKAIKKKEVDANINEKYLDFEAVLNRVQNSGGGKQMSFFTNTYRLAVAASVLLLISLITYAWFYKPSKYAPKRVIVSKKPIAPDSLSLTSFHVPVSEPTLITTEDSLVIFIGSNILEPNLGPDTSAVLISRVQRLINEGNHGISFYISFKKQTTKIPVTNIYLLLPYTDSIQPLFGGISTKNKTWKSMDPDDREIPIINEPSPLMLTYQKYKDSKLLLDSIDSHYQLEHGFYVNEKRKGFKYEQKFIQKLRKELKDFEQNSQFEANVKYAVYSWRLYRQQHQLKISKKHKNKSSRNPQLSIPISQAGWYGIISQKK